MSQVRVPGLRRVVLYGPECTGKTTLACQLAAYFDTLCVGEFARPYLRDKLADTGENCTLEDILPIAMGQQAEENRLALKARHGLLFCDTDLLTIKAYSELYFDSAPPALTAAIPSLHHNLYLLTDIDVSWAADGIRDRSENRAGMLDYFQALLERYGKPYVKISGSRQERLRTAIGQIESMERP